MGRRGDLFCLQLTFQSNGVKGDDDIWNQFEITAAISGTDLSNAAYFRLNAAYIGEDSIITVNEEII